MAASKPNSSQLSSADQAKLTAWLDDFNRSWNEGRLAARVRELPAPPSPLRRPALIELVKLDLERRWQGGRRVLLDAYLKAYPELGTAETVPVELIHGEWEVRRQHGSRVKMEEYARRFPQQAPELERRVGQATPATEGIQTKEAAPPKGPAGPKAAAAEPAPAPQPSPAPRKRAVWPWVAAVVALVGVVCYIAIAAVNRKPDKVEIANTVVVRLEGIKALNDPTVKRFRLDGEDKSKEELSGKLKLKPGEHKLEVTRKDGKVENITFNVGEDDNEKSIKIPEKDQQVVVNNPPDEPPVQVVEGPPADDLPDQDEIPLKAKWYAQPVMHEFKAEKTTYHPDRKTMTWHTKALRSFTGYVNSEMGNLRVRFYDADGARIHDAGFGYEPNHQVKKGQKVRVSFDCPSEAVMEKTKWVLVVRPQDKDYPAHLANKLPGRDYQPPEMPPWDTAYFRRHFALLKVGYNDDHKHVYWLARAKRPFGGYVNSDMGNLRVRYYDGYDVRVYDTGPSYDPGYDVRKGECIRIWVELPGEAVVRKTKRVLLIRPEMREFPAHPGPKYEGARWKPPGKTTWDTTTFQKYFHLLKTYYDEEHKHLIWLVEANKAFGGYVNSEIALRVRFYDADDVRVYGVSPRYDPGYDVRKGERLRIWIALPSEGVQQQTHRVLMLKPTDKEFPDHPGTAYKAARWQPSGLCDWDAAPLDKYFEVLKTSYDEKRKKVTWLVQAKRAIGGYVNSEVNPQAKCRFYDASNTRVHEANLSYGPRYDIRKGERLRVYLDLPAEEVMRKTKKVVLEKP
jgi:hypothetical protein